MKNILLLFCFPLIAFSQTPQGINYQAVARDTSGIELKNQSMDVIFTYHIDSVNGPWSYRETHYNVITNEFGLFNVVLGEGTPTAFPYTNIQWDRYHYFLQVELNLGNGNIDMGTVPFYSVPYSLVAEEAMQVEWSNVSNKPIIPTLPSGSANQTLAHNGSDWEASSNIQNPGDSANMSVVFNNTNTNGTVWGIYNNLYNVTSDGTKVGLYNVFPRHTDGNRIGVYNYHASNDTTSGSIYGLNNSFYASGSANQYGTKTYISGGKGALYGSYNSIFPSSQNSNTGIGVYGYVSASGTGTHYGGYFMAQGSGNYGIYAYNVTSGGYAGYFSGDVNIDGDIYNNGSLLTSSSPQTLSLSGNTLSISGGNTVSLPTSLQTLSLSGNTVSISGGNSITLSTPSTFWQELSALSTSYNSSNPQILYDGDVGVGIGSYAPTAKFHVNDNDGGDAFRVQIQNNTRFSVNDQGGVAIGYYTSTQPDRGLYVYGDVAIGRLLPATGYKLSVDGKVICEELKVQTSTSWPDYVFENNYDLMSLEQLELYIDQNKHLPGFAPASEVEENGFEVGHISNKLLEKVEELTLYMIDANKRIIELEREIEELKK